MAASATPAPGPRRRLLAAVLAAVTVGAGLTVKLAAPHGVGNDIAGDALYAVLIYLLVVALLPRLRPASAALIAVTTCVAVELFQLTDCRASGQPTFASSPWCLAPASTRATLPSMCSR